MSVLEKNVCIREVPVNHEWFYFVTFEAMKKTRRV